MPRVARGDAKDVVSSLTGSGFNCEDPILTATDECSPDVFANNVGIVREDDRVANHPAVGCGPDLSLLTTFSPSVFVNGKRAGRLNDEYTPDNTIITGSPNVFVE